MNRFHSLRRSVLALVVLGVWWLAGPVAAAQAAPFDAAGTFTITSRHGNQIDGILSGRASPGGPFTGGFSHRHSPHGVLNGVATLDFAGGCLFLAYHLELDPATDEFVGTFVIIDGGTGAFSGATGGGSMINDNGPTGDFALSGTIDR